MPFQKNIDVIGFLTPLDSGMDTKIMGAWEAFYRGNLKEQVPNRLTDDVYCIYTNYQGDHTKPMDMLIGFPVPKGTPCPKGLHAFTIPEGSYKLYVSEGPLPDALIQTWQDIWQTCTNRAFGVDVDYYPSCSESCVETYISVTG